jgi:hypothetical protein
MPVTRPACRRHWLPFTAAVLAGTLVVGRRCAGGVGQQEHPLGRAGSSVRTGREPVGRQLLVERTAGSCMSIAVLDGGRAGRRTPVRLPEPTSEVIRR